ncbi:MAG: methyltransferase domain-containing protein [Ottowia sp.]|uniref:methyltransferase domain-containing protein n=1 Tax=Ottowia sp. TaxID=1898956 RepID=UPI003C72BBA2
MYPEHKHHHNWLIKKTINDKLRARLPVLVGRVLDLGCGTRPFETDILEYADEYIGVDWSNTLHNLKADIISDLNKPLPIPSVSFDHIVSLEVLEHLHDPQMMLSEAFRILKSGGSITVSAPFMWWVHEAPWDYYRYTQFGHKYLFSKAGFVGIEVQPTTGFWSMWLLKLNYQTSRLIRGPWLVRLVLRAVLIPFWWINQCMAPLLDRLWPEENETAGYVVTAFKP